MHWRDTDAAFTRPAMVWRAKGCSPSSGSSITRIGGIVPGGWQQQSHQAEAAERAIRSLICPEFDIRPQFTPPQRNAPLLRFKNEVVDKRCDQPDRINDPAIIRAVLFPQPKKKRGKVGCVRPQIRVVGLRPLPLNACLARGIVKLIDLHPSQEFQDRCFASLDLQLCPAAGAPESDVRRPAPVHRASRSVRESR